jgi:hypothetical protein
MVFENGCFISKKEIMSIQTTIILSIAVALISSCRQEKVSGPLKLYSDSFFTVYSDSVLNDMTLDTLWKGKNNFFLRYQNKPQNWRVRKMRGNVIVSNQTSFFLRDSLDYFVVGDTLCFYPKGQKEEAVNGYRWFEIKETNGQLQYNFIDREKPVGVQPYSLLKQEGDVLIPIETNSLRSIYDVKKQGLYFLNSAGFYIVHKEDMNAVDKNRVQRH